MNDTALRTPTLLVALAYAALIAACSDRSPTGLRAASVLTIVSGNNEVRELNSSVVLSVRATDAEGNAVPGAMVTWATEGGGQVSAASTPTDAGGIAAVERKFGFQAGTYITTAALAGIVTTTVRFTSIAQVKGATEIVSASGNLQTDSIRATLAPFRVLLRNHKGAPVPGVEVLWIRLSGSGALTHESSVTDVNGIAETRYTFNTSAGPHRVIASVNGLIGDPVSFDAVATAGRPASIQKISGDDQIGAAGDRLFRDYTVRALDIHGNVAPSRFAWTVVSGGGTIASVLGFTASHTLGPQNGPQTVSVSALDGLPTATATFTSRAVSALVGVASDWYYGRFFSPGVVTVQAGSTVGWTWGYGCFYCINEEHDVTFEDAPLQPVSSLSQITGTHLRTFATPGVIRYRCTRHSIDFERGMVGKVVVD